MQTTKSLLMNHAQGMGVVVCELQSANAMCCGSRVPCRRCLAVCLGLNHNEMPIHGHRLQFHVHR